MSVEVRLLPNARRDRDSTLRWLEEQDHLADIQSYLDDFYATLRFIAANHLLRREVEPGVRHESLTTYKYHVWFRTYEAADFVDVFAVFHHSVDPAVLARRIAHS